MIAPTEHYGLREQNSTSAAPGRKFQVNALGSIRIPLAAGWVVWCGVVEGFFSAI